VNRRLFLLYGIPSVITAYIGAQLLERLDITAIAIFFAIFIIVFSVYSLIKPKWSLPDRNGLLVTGGLLSGFTAGLIGLGGAIRSMFLISTSIKKEIYIATAAAIAVVVDITRITVYIANSSLDSDYYWYILPLIVIAFAGTYWGVKLLKNLSDVVVKRAVLAMLILVGLQMLLEQAGVI